MMIKWILMNGFRSTRNKMVFIRCIPIISQCHLNAKGNEDYSSIEIVLIISSLISVSILKFEWVQEITTQVYNKCYPMIENALFAKKTFIYLISFSLYKVGKF